jgi:hypothetical protein
MKNLLIAFNQGLTGRATIDATLIAYNNSCVEMRSEARDSAIHLFLPASVQDEERERNENNA